MADAVAALDIVVLPDKLLFDVDLEYDSVDIVAGAGVDAVGVMDILVVPLDVRWALVKSLQDSFRDFALKQDDLAIGHLVVLPSFHLIANFRRVGQLERHHLPIPRWAYCYFHGRSGDRYLVWFVVRVVVRAVGYLAGCFEVRYVGYLEARFVECFADDD